MSGFFGAVSKRDCVMDVFYGTDYHTHLGAKRAGMAFYNKDKGFQRAIHSLEAGYSAISLMQISRVLREILVLALLAITKRNPS